MEWHSLRDTPVERILASCPAAAQAFVTRGMSCPGCELSGLETLADAACHYGVDLDDLIADISHHYAQQG